MLIGNNAAVYVLPESVAIAAVDCGLPMDKAYELANKVTLATMARVAEFFGKPAQAWMSPAGRSRIYEADCLGAVDWRSLAERAGEPAWTPPVYSSAWPAAHQGQE